MKVAKTALSIFIVICLLVCEFRASAEVRNTPSSIAEEDAAYEIYLLNKNYGSKRLLNQKGGTNQFIASTLNRNEKQALEAIAANNLMLLRQIAGVEGRAVKCGCYCGKMIDPPCSDEACIRACGDSSQRVTYHESKTNWFYVSFLVTFAIIGIIVWVSGGLGGGAAAAIAAMQ